MRTPWNILRSILDIGKSDPSPSGTSGLELADALLSDLIAREKVPGLSIKALLKGKEWFSGGYGYADLGEQTGVDPEASIFRIASISKPITSCALASLVSDGILDLQEDIRVFVPEFPVSHGRVTLEQLASHTAGIRSYKGKEFALNKPMSISDSLELFIRDPLEFTPGKGYNYTSFDFVLLALAMERAVGKPFHELVLERVLDPLQMEATVVENPGAPLADQVTFYSRTPRGFRESVPVDTRFKLAGGGYLSTVSDVCRLGLGCLDGRAIPKVLESDFLTTMEVDGTSTFYGLGWEVSSDAKGRNFYGHTGNAIGAYSNFKVFPKEQLVLGILINASVPEVQPILDAVIEALHQSIPPNG